MPTVEWEKNLLLDVTTSYGAKPHESKLKTYRIWRFLYNKNRLKAVADNQSYSMLFGALLNFCKTSVKLLEKQIP